MTAMTSARSFAALFVCVLPLLWYGQPAQGAPFQGDPPVTRLVPQVDVFPQNFAIAQDTDAVIYVGNSEGVLIHDGERWSLLRLPNEDIVRSLAHDGAGRIYVGGYNLFGYLERDIAGQPVFHDLTGEFSAQLGGEQFADIWDIEVAGQGVFFRALKHVFFYAPASGKARLWRHEGRFGDIVRNGDDVVLQFRGEGLRRFVIGDDGAGWEPLPGSERLTNLIPDLVVLPSGGLLTIAIDGDWLEYRDEKVIPFAMPAGFPDSSGFTHGCVTGDGTLAMTTEDGALYFLDLGTGGYRRLQLTTEFLSGLAPAVGGGLLVSSNQAVFHVGWPPEWTMLGREHGLAGSLHNLARWGERWFVLNSAGMQELISPEDPAGERFGRNAWATHASWDFLPLDENSALLAESYELKQVRNDQVTSLTHRNFYPRLLRRSEYDADIVYVGTELGLAVIRRTEGEWRLHLERNDLDAPRINSIVQAGSHELWLGSERGGIMRVFFTADHSAIERLERPASADGIEYGRVTGGMVTRLPAGGLMASTARGFFEWRDGRFHASDMDGLAALRGDNEFLWLRAGPDGDQWAYSYKHIFHRPRDGSWRAEDVRSQLRGAIESLTFDDAGGAIFTSTTSILRHDAKLQVAQSVANNAAVRLRSVALLRSDGGETPLPLRTPTPLVFDAGDVNLRFRFSLPDFTVEEGVRYSARLVGLEKQMSGWSKSSGFTYYRMRPGDYQLEVRARDSGGRVSEIEPFRFRVKPEWYASAWAKAAWALLLLVLTGALFQLFALRRTRRLAADKARLENMVAKRTRELESANRQLHAAAHLDGLTEIANRRRLDEYLAQVWRQCAEHGRPLSLLVIDVDHFKRYNDNNGHLAGDRLLQKLARSLSQSLRRSEDLVARYGGEEFLVVLPGAELAAAEELAETMRQNVEISSLGATISIGAASMRPDVHRPFVELVSRADAALYQAKADGRNCVRRDDA